jgi:hypothetical protein
MKRLMALGAVVVACLAVPLGASSAAPATTVCSQNTYTFSGSATTLVVPADGYCQISNATIAQDLILGDDAGADLDHVAIGRDLIGGQNAGGGFSDSTIGRDLSLRGGDGGADLAGVTVGRDYVLSAGAGTHMERTSIGHDFVGNAPQTVQTGRNGPDTPGGPVYVGHDLSISGTPDEPFVFDGICDMHVGHDVRLTNRSVNLGIGFAGFGCHVFGGEPGNTVAHDLIVTGNTAEAGDFGAASLRIGDNKVGHDLVFANNVGTEPGTLVVTNNVVGHDLLCSGNSQAITVLDPNSAGHLNTCGG